MVRSGHRGRQLDELSAWALPSEEIDRLLAVGNDPRLKALFGSDLDELCDLARQSQGSVRAAGPRVLLIPGILGSTIGKPGNFFTRDTIWFDPVSLRRGDITRLKLNAQGNSQLTSLDVVPVIHSLLRLRLKVTGFSVEYYHYDWRKSLASLGKELAQHIAGLPGTVRIVAHSMGGLVARAALKAGADKVDRVVMLGTPNRGSFASVEVLQGVNANVVIVDKLDPHHDAEQLTRSVFSTFPSIYELLPRPAIYDRIDLFKPDNWPVGRYHPPTARLQSAVSTWKRLTDADSRLHLIAGYGQDTVTDLSADDNSQFVYHRTFEGDGTVPLKMCELPGVPTRYVSESHTGLLRHRDVARAVADLLKAGTTARLSDTAETVRGTSGKDLRYEDFAEASMRSALLGTRTGAAIDPADLPILLETAMSLSTLPLDDALRHTERAHADDAVTGAGSDEKGAPRASGQNRLTAGITFNQTVISRDHQSHLELELFPGNLFDVPYRAVVVGIFSDVDPVGPARTLDKLTGGAVTELLFRRMFDAAEGKVFVMPTGRNPLKADYVVFAGLGNYKDFALNPDNTLRIVSCNILRTLMNCGVDEFATLVFGGASGISIRRNLESFVSGFLDALKALGSNNRSVQFRRVALCELSKDRYAELKDEAYRLGGTTLCDDIRLRLHEVNYPATAASIAASIPSRHIEGRPPESVVYLTVQVEKTLDSTPRDEADEWIIHASLLGASSKATIFPSAHRIDRTKLDELLDELPGSPGPTDRLLDVGLRIRNLLFSPDFIRVLEHDLNPDDHLVVIVDATASRIPWEALPLNLSDSDEPPDPADLSCVNGGLSRRFRTDGTNSVARYLEERQYSEILRVLLVVNPTGDLDGADKEGEDLERVLFGLELVQVKVLRHDEATREAILQEMGSGRYDVLHYAGHAFFDPEDRSRSGLICAGSGPVHGSSVLNGQDVSQLPHLPSTIVFNACESARIRSLPVPSGVIDGRNLSARRKLAATGNRSEQQAGLCEALLRGGISQFVGTYWPVDDNAAKVFAARFYEGLLSGKTVRESVISGRNKVYELPAGPHPDFANYIHYGDPTFVVKVSTNDPA